MYYIVKHELHAGVMMLSLWKPRRLDMNSINSDCGGYSEVMSGQANL
jgi:hypothetical protein